MANRLNRRQFLSMSAALCASTALGGASPANPVPSKTTRAGLIGCGVRGCLLLESLRKQSGTRVVAVSDCDPAAIRNAHHHAPRAYPGWRRMLEDPNVDVVLIATPDHLHAEIVEAAFAQGKDVYCEAPFCRTWHEAERLRSHWDNSGRVVQIGAAEISDPRWRLAREIVRSGRLGDLVWCQVAQPAIETRPQTNGLDWRRYSACSGGAALEWQFRALAALLHATALTYPARVSVIGGMTTNDARETPDTLLTTLEYPEGATVVLAASGASAAKRPTVLRGTRASLLFTAEDVFLQVTEECPAVGASTAPTRSPVGMSSLDAHLRNWLDAVRSRGECIAGPTLACKTQAAIDAAFIAFQQRRTVTCDPVRGLLV